jgi:hypothetical protein
MPAKGHGHMCGRALKERDPFSSLIATDTQRVELSLFWSPGESISYESGSSDFVEWQDVDGCPAATLNVQRRIRHMSHRVRL